MHGKVGRANKGGDRVKTIIIVIISCWILYKSGAVRKLLTAFKLKDCDQVADVGPTSPPVNRQQLQAHAIYILESRGLSTDYVKYMSNRLLAEIIEEYYTSR